MKLMILTFLTLSFSSVPVYSTNWQFVTSDSTDEGIDISYFVDVDGIKTMDGIRGYNEKRIYTRGKSLTNIGILQITGYYDCTNENYLKASITFLGPGEEFLGGYIVSGDEYTWKPVTQRHSHMMYEYVCKFK